MPRPAPISLPLTAARALALHAQGLDIPTALSRPQLPTPFIRW